MRDVIKCIILVFGSFFCIVLTFFTLGFALSNIQQYSKLLIIPELSLILFIAAIITLMMWSIRFASYRPHTKLLLYAFILLLSSMMFFSLSIILH